LLLLELIPAQNIVYAPGIVVKLGLRDRMMQAVVLARQAVVLACGAGFVTPAEPGGGRGGA
jgi:hypothetical protein